VQINRRRLFGLMGATALTPAFPGAAAPMLTGTAGAIATQGALATATVVVSSIPPGEAVHGALWFEAGTFRLRRRQGSEWVDIRSAIVD